MAWYPFANKKLIKPGPNDPPIIVVGAILHVDAGNNKSLYEYFRDKSGGIESHFHVPKAGPVEQYRDTGYEADANLKANSFTVAGLRFGFVSIETQGLEKGEWNEWQLQEIKRLLSWLSATHSFPLKVTTNPRGPGVGYHTLFGAPGPWTPVAKSCPGPDRVRQFNDVLVPWFTENHQVPSNGSGGPGKAVGVDEVLKAVQAHEAAEAKRYADVRGLVQKLYDAEAGRYAEYSRWHDTTLTAVAEVEQRLSDAGIE